MTVTIGDPGGVTDAQLREAERRLRGLLHTKNFPREWIEAHAPEAMAQARSDFAARLAAGKEDQTVSLLVVIGYRRALKILRSQKTGPQTTSLEAVFHVADESIPTPEQEAFDHDRREQVTRAMSELPERERQLLALHYAGGMSIRAAGRRLGWRKSAADEHHQAALKRLEGLLDRSLLAPEIAIPAYVAARHSSGLRAIAAWFEGAAETAREAVVLSGSRLGLMAEAGSAAAASGAGRTAAGVCGLAVAACLAGAASGVVGPVAILPRDSHSAAVEKAPPSPAAVGGIPSPSEAQPSLPGTQLPAPASRAPARSAGASSGPRRRRASTGPTAGAERPASEGTRAPGASTAAGEFGLEGGEAEGSPPRDQSPAVENSPISPEPSSAPQPSSGSGSGGSSESSGGRASGPEAQSEFGM